MKGFLEAGSGGVELARIERPARTAKPIGILALLHGRGSNAADLAELFEVLDPDQNFHAVSFQAPLTFESAPGFHWYEVKVVGKPEAEQFLASLGMLHRSIDRLLSTHRFSRARLAIAGFSQGAVMSIATAFDQGVESPALVGPWSGFVPIVEGWNLDPAAAKDVPVLLTHGAVDSVINIGFGRRAKVQLEAVGAKVEWSEPPIAHQLDVDTVVSMRTRLREFSVSFS